MKKMKKYQKGSQVQRPQSTKDFQVVDDNTLGSTTGYDIIKRPTPISSDSLAKERFADTIRNNRDKGMDRRGTGKDMDPGFKRPSKPKPEIPREVLDELFKNAPKPYKKGGTVTALNKVQEMYSKKKK
jgi:hypothetical protein